MSWYDDSIVFGQNAPAGAGASIMRISVKGGKVETLLTLKEGELVYSPQILPGGQTMLFTVANAAMVDRWNNARIVAQSLASNERKVLIEAGSDARYVPTGHLVYALGGTLRAVAFDVSRLEVIGEPVPIVEGVLRAPTTASGAAHFNFSTNGALVYVPGQPGANSNESYVGLIDRKGNLKRLNLPPGRYASPRISPDGKRVALGADDGKEANIWTYELSGATSPKRLTFGGSNRFPIWTRNGERIAFQSDREGDRGIFWQRAEGAGIAERLTKAEPKNSHLPDSWSPDGQNMSFTFERENSDGDVWILSVRDKKTGPLIQAATSFQGRSVFSPDGRWVAYQSTESGLSQIFVQPFPTTGAIYQLFKTNAVSAAPMWSPDSKNLFYVDRLPGPGRLNALGFTTNPSLVFGNPVPLAVAGLIQLPPPGNPRNYDVTPDGSQFVLIFDSTRTESETPVLEIRVVLNWFEDLKQRVPLR
jgi:eukaryotic-like serine/threonine-protein kinase